MLTVLGRGRATQLLHTPLLPLGLYSTPQPSYEDKCLRTLQHRAANSQAEAGNSQSITGCSSGRNCLGWQRCLLLPDVTQACPGKAQPAHHPLTEFLCWSGAHSGDAVDTALHSTALLTPVH